MKFNSLQFLLFFPLVAVAFYALPHRFRWMMLLCASCLFYMAFIPAYILILAVTIVIDYGAGIFIEDASQAGKRRLLLTVSIVSTCTVLAIFKYSNFIIGNLDQVARLFDWNQPVPFLKIILPIGLSFHTFQSLSYVIEVYRGHQKAERHFGIYALYVMFFPQLVAGPIERPQNLLHQFREQHRFDYENVSQGLKQMVWGFFMKLVVADRAAIYVNAVYNNVDQHSGLTFIAATVFFAFQIYCDFAGYSNIAIGSARVLGFRLMQNFNRPYFSESIGEFWKRWHISLSTWFRDYLYISLGGNRVRRGRHLLNLLITFLVSGFWHGANWTFVIWGGVNGLYLIIENVSSQFAKRLRFTPGRNGFLRAASILVTFALTCIAWVFFRAGSLGAAMTILSAMARCRGPLYIPTGGDVVTPLYAAFAILLLAAVEIKHEYFPGSFSLFNNRLEAVRLSAYGALVGLILMIGVFNGGQFIYFQF